MYRLSNNVDLSFLYGVELQQVCIGENEVILNFDRDIRITILSSFAVASKRDTPITTYHEAAKGGSAILSLLHLCVSKAEATDTGGLLLEFNSGASVNIFDDSDQYESFWIANQNEQIIV